MRQIVDSTNQVIYEGNDAESVLRVLSAEPSDVTEEDEVQYEPILRSAEWTGNLRIILVYVIKFKGVDDWNRPVFKATDAKLYFGCTSILFDYNDDPKKIIEFFTDHIELLEYFGQSFNCEPHGGMPFKYPVTLKIENDNNY